MLHDAQAIAIDCGDGVAAERAGMRATTLDCIMVGKSNRNEALDLHAEACRQKKTSKGAAQTIERVTFIRLWAAAMPSLYRPQPRCAP